MASVVADFFGIIGVDMIPPDTLSELIPYILTVTVGLCLVSGVFGVIGHLAALLMDSRRW